jgi:aspartokinase
MCARALRRLCDEGLEVLTFSQSFSEHTLNLVVSEQDHEHCIRVLCHEFGGNGEQAAQVGDATMAVHRLDGRCSLCANGNVATVSVAVVGVPGWRDTSIVSHAFAALGEHGVRVIAVAQTASEYSISFCIPQEQVVDTVRLLHRELGLEQPT